MRKLERESLSESASARLRARTQQIKESAAGLTTTTEQFQAQKAEARRLWDQEGTVAFNEIKECLTRMAPGDGQCMYCESGEASHIDHFWPKATYPDRTYDWSNHLWACSVCNSNHKRDQFPIDESNQPLLINPVEEDPREHLELSPKTGKYVGLTCKGKQSIHVFGLGRGTLERSRKRAWSTVQAHVITYALYRLRGNDEAAHSMKDALCMHPHASVFYDLLRMLDTEGGPSIISRDCIAAIAAHPEIRRWV